MSNQPVEGSDDRHSVVVPSEEDADELVVTALTRIRGGLDVRVEPTADADWYDG